MVTPTFEAEGGVLAGLVGQHLQQRRLRHRAHLPAAEPCGVGADDQPSAGVDLDGLHLDVRKAVELLAEPHLPEGVDAAPLQALAAEGAGEVVVRLQHRHAHAAPRQQVGQRHPGRARPHDDHPARLPRHDGFLPDGYSARSRRSSGMRRQNGSSEPVDRTEAAGIHAKPEVDGDPHRGPF